MLIDELMPKFDRSKVETVIVEARPELVYAAVLEADLVQAYKGSLATRALFAARKVPSGIARRIHKQPPPPEPEAWRIGEMPERGEWVKLGEESGSEIVFGAIGRFWGRDIDWETIEAKDFEGFDLPGYGKIAANFSLRSYGTGRTLLTYEARTVGTDPASSLGIKRYWVLVSPGVGIVLTGTLRYIRSLAQRS